LIDQAYGIWFPELDRWPFWIGGFDTHGLQVGGKRRAASAPLFKNGKIPVVSGEDFPKTKSIEMRIEKTWDLYEGFDHGDLKRREQIEGIHPVIGHGP